MLHEAVKTWWRTENFGCRYDCDVQRSVKDGKVLKFLSERTQEVEGRYEVPLLWKDENIQLPDNRVVAIHRLGLLEKRLQRDPELGEAYKKTIDTDLEKGISRDSPKRKPLTKQSVRGTSLTIPYLILITLERSDMYVM